MIPTARIAVHQVAGIGGKCVVNQGGFMVRQRRIGQHRRTRNAAVARLRKSLF